jgi:hypothetical protein
MLTTVKQFSAGSICLARGFEQDPANVSAAMAGITVNAEFSFRIAESILPNYGLMPKLLPSRPPHQAAPCAVFELFPRPRCPQNGRASLTPGGSLPVVISTWYCSVDGSGAGDWTMSSFSLIA